MCRECGCGERGHGHEHHHDHGHEHEHDHEHDYGHEHDHGQERGHEHTVRRISLEARVLARTDQAAEQNRAFLRERGITALNLISSPGSGKTLLLERTLDALRGEIPCAVLAGDQQTENDARRLAGKGAEVRQIQTGSACHLDAQQVGRLLPEVCRGVRLLFIENVGNLVCPAAFDLGETLKVALLSVTEGEDKPVKYPALFSSAPWTVLTKIDLVPHLAWDRLRCIDSIRTVRPDALVLELSALTGQGMPAWLDVLRGRTRT